MPKKKSAQKKKRSDHYIVVKFIVAILATAFLLAGIGMFYQKNQEPTCANSESCIEDLTGEYNPNDRHGIFMGRDVTSPEFVQDTYTPSVVLGESTDKRIEVDLTNQRLYTYEGDKLIHNFPVSTGKWWPTPTGTFNIWIKLRSTKMSGGNKAAGTYYYLPNVPYTMYFYNDQYPKHIGYGIHGAYWHNNFGHPMSHGCVNMKEEEVAQVYSWAGPHSDKGTTYASADNPGTKVIIYGETPKE